MRRPGAMQSNPSTNTFQTGGDASERLQGKRPSCTTAMYRTTGYSRLRATLISTHVVMLRAADLTAPEPNPPKLTLMNHDPTLTHPALIAIEYVVIMTSRELARSG